MYLGDSLNGATIERATFTDPSEDETWCDHGELALHLSDGRTVSVVSSGYDASDVWVYIDGRPLTYTPNAQPEG